MKILLVLAACVYLTTADNTSCVCGYRNSLRIDEGEPKQKEFPWLVSILAEAPDKLSHVCGGSIITDWHVITTAHCVINRTVDDYRILVGAYNIKGFYYCRKFVCVYPAQKGDLEPIPVSELVIHEGFVGHEHDLALLVSSVQFEFSSNIGPPCMPEEGLNLVNENIVCTGNGIKWISLRPNQWKWKKHFAYYINIYSLDTSWNHTDYDGKLTHTVQKIDLNVISRDDCQKAWDKNATKIGPTQLCTRDEGNNACQADAGGPMVWMNPNTQRYTLVGVSSFGKGCAGSLPAVNTDVSQHLDWIKEHVKETQSEATLCTGF